MGNRLLIRTDPLASVIFEAEFQAWLPGALDRAGVPVPEGEAANVLLGLVLGMLVSVSRVQGVAPGAVMRLVEAALGADVSFEGVKDA